MIIKLAALGAIGYAGYRYFQKNGFDSPRAAFAGNQQGATIRDAGPDAMRDQPIGSWSKVDEESDHSFPASDPPANY